MIKLKMGVPGGEMEITGDNQREIFEQASFWQNLPTVCPLDGYPTRMDHRQPQGNDYYQLQTTGPFPFVYKLGIRQEDHALFPKNQWVYFSRDAINEETGKRGTDVIVWDRGRLVRENLPAGVNVPENVGSAPAPAEAGPNGPTQAPQQAAAAPQAAPQTQSAAPPQSDADKLSQARNWIRSKLNQAEIPANMHGRVLSHMLALEEPLASTGQLTIEQARTVAQMIRDDSGSARSAYEDVKQADDVQEFPPEDDVPEGLFE